MIARLAISPQALIDLGAGLPARQAKANHDQLLRALRAHGTLVFASADEARALAKVLKGEEGLPPGASKKWTGLFEEFLTRSPKRAEVLNPPASFSFGVAHQLDELRTAWAGRADVAILDDEQGDRVGIPLEEGWLAVGDGQFEVATGSSAAHCRRLTRFQDMMDRGFAPVGSSREIFWEDVLGPLARVSRTASVVDRYLFKDLLGNTRRVDSEHVVWLLQHLEASLRGNGPVTLIAERFTTETAQDVMQAIDASWPRGRTRSFEIVVVLVPKGMTSRRNVRFPHDRHIRFDVGAAVVVPAGFDRLRGSTIRDPDGMKWDYKWAAEPLAVLRSAEQRCVEGEAVDVARA